MSSVSDNRCWSKKERYSPFLPFQTSYLIAAATGLLFVCSNIRGHAAGPGAQGNVGPAAATQPTSATAEEKPRLFKPYVWGPENEWKLQVGGEVRARIENRHNYDLRDNVADNDRLSLWRTRLNFDVTHRACVRTFLEVMDARVFGAQTDILQEDNYDIHQLFMEFSDPDAPEWKLRLGRQEMSFGEKRLVDSAAWVNLIRTWEGARLIYKDKTAEHNFFLVQQDLYERHFDGAITTGRKQRKKDEWFYGVYSTFKHHDPHEFDLYLLGLSDLDDTRTFPADVKSESGEFGTSDRYTAGTRVRGPIWKQEGCGVLGYGAEAAYQFGHVSSDEIRAYMLHGDLNYTWEQPWKPKLVFEGNLATGDRDPDDGKSNTFNPLFHNIHVPYGIIDFVRLQNMRELAITASAQPTPKLKTQLELHQFWLDSKTDAWPGGFGRDKTGRSGRSIGHEMDAIATYKLNKFTTLETGVAHFFSGEFARNIDRGDGANLFYMQCSFVF